MSQKKDSLFRQPVFMVMELIGNSPNKEYHVRMLAKETGLSTTAVLSAIKELAAVGFVSLEKTKIVKKVRANLESETYRFYKLLINLYRLKKYGLLDALIGAFHRPEAIVLFGSYAKGEDVENSDIDILVISAYRPKELENLRKIYGKTAERQINIHVLPSLKRSMPEFKNAAANGIVLYGYLKMV
ncbi:nucleotidyltransferase domain-containing protein [Candidatus Woesearchaeota archaeon]|nr:nucleotidyltransferase domain-containing protein [Candidatus Woesearchaeota archaeon]